LAPQGFFLFGVFDIGYFLAKSILFCNFGYVIASFSVLYILELGMFFALVNIEKDTADFIHVLHVLREPWNPDLFCLLD
jgi:hypothetical protein